MPCGPPGADSPAAPARAEYLHRLTKATPPTRLRVRLTDFILANIEPILVEWTAFARTQDAAAGLSRVELRDHAAEILRHIAHDLATPQSDEQQVAKSRGEADSVTLQAAGEDGAVESPAETHGADRAMNGFSFSEMIAEFRALRATVLRLWIRSRGTLNEGDLDDLMRFNEAVDQAVAESVSRFSRDLDGAKDMFVAILTHDLRSPLQSVLLTTKLLLDGDVEQQQRIAALHRIERSTSRMNGMIDDLLDFTRTRIGSGLRISKVETDLGEVVREAVDEARGAYPSRRLELQLGAALSCRCDPMRMKQVLANLISNAAEYGDPLTPVVIELQGATSTIVLTVANRGEVIPPGRMGGIFDPFKRLQLAGDEIDETRHLGLGLYIAEQIVQEHGGHIGVTSTAGEGTCFTVSLPR